MGSDETQVTLPDREPFSEGPWGTDKTRPMNPAERGLYRVLSIWDGPATWLRGEWDSMCAARLLIRGHRESGTAPATGETARLLPPAVQTCAHCG